MPNKLTIEEFIIKSNLIHNSKYDYSKVEYTNNSTKVLIICPFHGEFLQTPSDHLVGKSCKKCGTEKTIKSRLLTVEQFIEKAKKVHGNKYDYSLVDYIGSKKLINIICPVHNSFKQQPDNHLSGKGCSLCATSSTYSKSNWLKVCNSKICEPVTYIIRCYNEEENFLKIGRTSKPTKNRFNGNYNMPYSYEIIKEYKGTPEFVWDKEIELHKLYKTYSYKPLLPFGGQKECFNISILQDILKHF